MTKEIEKTNHAFCKETLHLKQHLEGTFIELGKRLMDIRDNQLYTPFWSSFDEFLMEMKLSKGTASKLISIYQVFVLQYKIKPARLAAAGWSSLSEVLKVVKTKADAEKWVDTAGELHLRDLRDEVREKVTGVTERSCKHPNKYTIEICPDCPFRHRVDSKK